MSNGPQSMKAWSLGLDMAYAAGGMLLLGAVIDWLAGTRPWWMLGLGVLGLISGMYRFIRDAMRLNTTASPRERRETGGREAGQGEGSATSGIGRDQKESG